MQNRHTERQRIGDDETIAVLMTRRQAMIIEAWLIGRNARLEKGPDAVEGAQQTYVIVPPGAELDLRRATRKSVL